jgi:2-methylcitrate dehydratase PrpD
MIMSVQDELLSHVARLKYEDLPESVIEAAKKSILDTLVVLIAGSTGEKFRVIRGLKCFNKI